MGHIGTMWEMKKEKEKHEVQGEMFVTGQCLCSLNRGEVFAVL